MTIYEFIGSTYCVLDLPHEHMRPRQLSEAVKPEIKDEYWHIGHLKTDFKADSHKLVYYGSIDDLSAGHKKNVMSMEACKGINPIHMSFYKIITLS